MRLIDADALLQEIEGLSVHITGLRSGKGALSNFMNEYRKTVLRIIDEQPTAFDTEKVVEQLEEVKGKACTGKECFSCVYNDICCEGEMSERVAIDNAIKIVLKGGATD